MVKKKTYRFWGWILLVLFVITIFINTGYLIGELDIKEAFKTVKMKDIDAWIKHNIGTTILKKRNDTFALK